METTWSGIALPVFAVDDSGVVMAWNRRMQHSSGIAEADIGQRRLSDFLSDTTSWETALNHVIHPLTRVENIDHSEVDVVEYCTLELREGGMSRHVKRTFRVKIVANYAADGIHVVGAVCFAELLPDFSMTTNATPDIKRTSSHPLNMSDDKLRRLTELLPQNTQVLDARKEATLEAELKLTAYFAHELRNPLSALDSALNSVSDARPQEMKVLVAEMQSCIKIMSSIMNNLMDVRKLEEGKVILLTAPLSLPCLLTKVHKTLLPSVKPGVLFQVECCTKAQDWVLGDATRLQQILTNIAANAIKYTVTGTVTLKVAWENDMVTFVCIDTGPNTCCNGPLSSSQQAPCLLAYRCGAPSTGLEMVVAKHLVELMGGTLVFRGHAAADGNNVLESSCVVQLPLQTCDPMHHKFPTEHCPLLETPLRFLIVDDIKLNRQMLKRRLQNSIYSGCEVAEACTGEEALLLCGMQDFDVIIVDQYMEEAGGVMVGTDAIFALRRMGVEAIIIGCSGNDLDEEFVDAGVDIVWQKPIPSNEEIKVQICCTLREKRQKFDVNSSPPCI